ncbi:hypothetical protein ACIRG4_09255 [Streptomyces sp. NPDC102395]|uniref:hypothetical protein n=1 Tax=Streptomyces sp. NPDC102395 TaxID=3366168 RepID=UPI003804D734
MAAGDRAGRRVVDSYTIPVTLRQIFYKLLMERLIPNSDHAYKKLSAETADRRRGGEFPPLFDQAAGSCSRRRGRARKKGCRRRPRSAWWTARPGSRSRCGSGGEERARRAHPSVIFAELLGRIRDLQTEWTEDDIVRITTENSVLKKHVRELEQENRRVTDRFAAAGKRAVHRARHSRKPPYAVLGKGG